MLFPIRLISLVSATKPKRTVKAMEYYLDNVRGTHGQNVKYHRGDMNMAYILYIKDCIRYGRKPKNYSLFWEGYNLYELDDQEEYFEYKFVGDKWFKYLKSIGRGN